MILLGGQAPHVPRANMGAHRTCGWPHDTKPTPTRVALNGPEHVRPVLVRVDDPVVVAVPARKRAVTYFGWVFFLISSGSPRVRCTPMGRTCGEPDEIGYTPMGVELNGSRHVRLLDLVHRVVVVRPRPVPACHKKAATFSGWWAFVLISLGGPTPHVLRAHVGGASYVRNAKRSRIDPHWGEIENYHIMLSLRIPFCHWD